MTIYESNQLDNSQLYNSNQLDSQYVLWLSIYIYIYIYEKIEKNQLDDPIWSPGLQVGNTTKAGHPAALAAGTFAAWGLGEGKLCQVVLRSWSKQCQFGYFTNHIPNFDKLCICCILYSNLKPISKCLSIFKDEGWYGGIDLRFSHIWCWSNVHDISQTSRETLGNGTVGMFHAARPRVAQMGAGAPRPQGILSVHGQGQVEEIESDWTFVGMLWLVGLIDLKLWKHFCWEIAHIHHGLLKGTSRVDLYFYIQAWRTWSRALVPPQPWWWKDGRPLSPRWDTWSFVVLPKWTPTTSGAPLSFWRIWA